MGSRIKMVILSLILLVSFVGAGYDITTQVTWSLPYLIDLAAIWLSSFGLGLIGNQAWHRLRG